MKTGSPVNLFLTLLVIVVIALQGCAPTAPTQAPEATQPPAATKAPEATQPPAATKAPEATQPPAAATSKYKEAPMLADLVNAGKLPPVDERLPKNPVVISDGIIMPKDMLTLKIGRYSKQIVQVGTWGFEAAREPLFLSSNLSSQISEGNIIEKFTYNDAKTVFNFTIRAGIKWSDGVPVTTEDVKFAVEDVLFNTDIYPNLPLMYRTQGSSTGTPMKLDVQDDFNFTITFDKPYGGFIDMISENEFYGYEDLFKPKHYLQQFHIKYADKAKLDQAVADAKLTNWYELFNQKDLRAWTAMNPNMLGLPVLNAWVLQSNEKGKMVAVRNPYYFAVDTAGNQLPYFDQVVGIDAPADSSAMMMGFTGQVDISGGVFTDAPVMLQNQKDVYKVYFYGDNGSRALYLNLTKDDPSWQKVVNDLRFRQALNYALDKETIIKDYYAGYGTPSIAAPTEFSPDKANALLDAMGMTQKDADGYRMTPDGKPFAIHVDVGPWTEYRDPINLIAPMFKDVGIKIDFKELTPELLNQRVTGNLSDARYDWNRANTWTFRHNHDYLVDYRWGALWRQWLDTGGKQGQQPPDWINELLAIHQRILETVPGTPEDQAAMKDLYAWYNKYIPYFTIVDGPVYPTMINNRIDNVMTDGYGHSFPRTWKILFATKD